MKVRSTVHLVVSDTLTSLKAHERTVMTDLAMGLLKDICKARPDLKLLISSATLDAQKFSEFFDSAPILNVPGRMFEVSIHYTKQPEVSKSAGKLID